MRNSKRKYHWFKLRLSRSDRKKVKALLHQGGGSTRVLRRVLILHQLSQGKDISAIAADLGMSGMGVRNVGTRYLKEGLERALEDAPRPGKPPLINKRQEKEIVAVACSAPPGERERWTLELLRHELVNRGIVLAIGRETLRTFLHEARVKPWLEKKCGALGS